MRWATVRSPRTRRAIAFAIIQLIRLVLFGGILLYFGGASIIMFSNFDAPHDAVRLADGLAMVVLIGLVAATRPLLRLTRRLAVHSEREVRRNDPRPPVLYLRAFAIDDEGREDLPVSGVTSALGALRSCIYLMLGLEGLTYEEELERVFNNVGPLVAIGRPDERLAPAGAARFYATPEQWQDEVMQRLSTARAVIVRFGRSEGVRWEIETVLRTADPRRILFVLPNAATAKVAHQQAVAELNTLLATPLKRISMGQATSFVFFDEGWIPRVGRMQTHAWWKSLITPSALNLRGSLAPFVGRLRALDAGGATARRFRWRSRLTPLRLADLACVIGLLAVFPSFLGWTTLHSNRAEKCARLASVMGAFAASLVTRPDSVAIENVFSLVRVADDSVAGYRCRQFRGETIETTLRQTTQRAYVSRFDEITTRISTNHYWFPSYAFLVSKLYGADGERMAGVLDSVSRAKYKQRRLGRSP